MNYRVTTFCLVYFGLIWAGISFSAQSLEATQLNTIEVDFFNEKLNRPTKVKFWFNQNSSACNTKICLRNDQDPRKVAVISHGAFGSPREMNWLGYALASQGWVVAGVAHYGESWVYGGDHIDPSSALRFWQRPQDVSYAIDSLNEQGLFNITLQHDQVLMLGHSSGGFTSLAMAGASLSSGKSQAYCASVSAKEDKGCQYNEREQKPMSEEMLQQVTKLQAQMQDPRIAAVIALDPALGHAVNEKSLAKISRPVLILGSVENDFLPFNVHAKHYADHIQKATLVGIEQGAGHFVYIDQCNIERQVKGVSLCRDRDGVDRKAIQQQILKHVFGFIARHNFS